MITPLSLDDSDSATDDEVVAAYVADGMDEDGARAFLAVLRGRVPTDWPFD
ncbi:hypothetical protein [Leifsonia sp. NPDC080035]|uniref:Anti-sigma factor n=1 Tax=Leifsonia sp. NPDC080035 TaxID=3143936 RepID=A0AAU7GC56_9MICO